MTDEETLGHLLHMINSLTPEAQAQIMEEINKELPAGQNLLELRDRAVLTAIHRFLRSKPERARKILSAIDTIDTEVYALIEDEPTN